jgi:uncharacterized membrane protein
LPKDEAMSEGGSREWIMGLVEPLATVLELCGIAVIVIGVILATAGYLRDLRGDRRKQAYESYRANLGRGILLGLELLVGADIIATVTAPLTFESVGLLGLVVLIRTFLSFSLETEIEGAWPWRRRQFTDQESAR